MSPQPLTPGDLVRYQATTSRWHLAVVRRVGDETVEIEFFWDGCEEVALGMVTPFRDYLDSRERVLSLKRADLCKVFFNKSFPRLREERLRIIQDTLRQHGLAFQPKHWPASGTRVRIWRDDSFVPADGSDKDAALEALLPRWLEPLKLPPSSRDPLGLQAPAERLANELLPGLTVFTSRVGYYGFLAWALQAVNGSPCPGGQTRQERLHRLERALALCEFVHHGAGDDSCPLLGQRSKTQVLQSAEGDRFRVPKRILKNQASAGAYRLYFTSLHSLGFVREAQELGADGLLPLAVTDQGGKLGHAFGQRLDGKFADFALGDGPLDRDRVRAWGSRLCFSALGGLGRYRQPFLDGFLLGNSPDAEKRYRTVRRLFERGLLTGTYEGQTGQPSPELVAEEEARVAEEVTPAAGLGNDAVLLRFYEETPQSDNRDFQAAAVFELLSLGLSALFQAVAEELRQRGRIRPANLAARVAGEERLNGVWTSPIAPIASRAPKARALVQRLLAADTPDRRAALGGALVLRVLGDPPLAALADELAATPAFLLVDAVLRSKQDRSLAEAFPDLVGAMVERHQVVSANKNRQRWCYLDGDAVVKDDLQEMRVGLHAFRFPQLFSLCGDLSLKAEELRHAV